MARTRATSTIDAVRASKPPLTIEPAWPDESVRGRSAAPNRSITYREFIDDARRHMDDPPSAGTGLRTVLRFYDGLECEGMDDPIFE
jgi:hypothetical protein